MASTVATEPLPAQAASLSFAAPEAFRTSIMPTLSQGDLNIVLIHDCHDVATTYQRCDYYFYHGHVIIVAILIVTAFAVALIAAFNQYQYSYLTM